MTDVTVAGMPSPKSQNRWRSLPAFAHLTVEFVPLLASVADSRSSPQAFAGATS